MAMIKCPRCGKEISDKAKKCVGCGWKVNIKEIREDGIVASSDILKRTTNNYYQDIGKDALLKNGDKNERIEEIVPNKRKFSVPVWGIISVILAVIILFIIAIFVSKSILDSRVKNDGMETRTNTVAEIENNNVFSEGEYVVGDILKEGNYQIIARRGMGTLEIDNGNESMIDDKKYHLAAPELLTMSYVDKIDIVELKNNYRLKIDKTLVIEVVYVSALSELELDEKEMDTLLDKESVMENENNDTNVLTDTEYTRKEFNGEVLVEGPNGFTVEFLKVEEDEKKVHFVFLATNNGSENGQIVLSTTYNYFDEMEIEMDYTGTDAGVYYWKEIEPGKTFPIKSYIKKSEFTDIGMSGFENAVFRFGVAKPNEESEWFDVNVNDLNVSF